MIREKIIHTLKIKGEAQRRCALYCGIDPVNFNHFLKGRRPLPLGDLEKILRHLNLTIMERTVKLIEERGCGVEYCIGTGSMDEMASKGGHEFQKDHRNGNGDSFTYRIEELDGTIVARIN